MKSRPISPTGILRDEHRVIERVLDALERFAALRLLDVQAIRLAIDFLKKFADGCHHAKEENELFPRLEAAGVPRAGGPIGCMLAEHDQGRAFIRAMSEQLEQAAAGDDRALRAFRAVVAGYVSLLRQHIWKEDHVLFELADRTLSAKDQFSMLSEFERADAADHAYATVADQLLERSQELSATAEKGAQS